MRKTVGLVSLLVTTGCNNYCDQWDIPKTIQGTYEVYPDRNAMYLTINVDSSMPDEAEFIVQGDEYYTTYKLDREEYTNDTVIFTGLIENIDPTQYYLNYQFILRNDNCPETVEQTGTLNLSEGYGSFIIDDDR